MFRNSRLDVKFEPQNVLKMKIIKSAKICELNLPDWT